MFTSGKIKMERKKETEIIANEELNEYLDRYFPKGDSRRGDALVLVAFANILLHKAKNSGERRKQNENNN